MNRERTSSCSRWPLESGGHVDASNQIQQTRTNRAAWDNSNRATERRHCVFKTDTFTIPSLFLHDAIRAIRVPPTRFAFWPSVCGKPHRTRRRPGKATPRCLALARVWIPFRRCEGQGVSLPGSAGRPELLQVPSLTINAFLTLTDVTKWWRAEPFWGAAEALLTLEIPWQPTKSRAELRVCDGGRAGSPVVPRQGCLNRGFSTGKARRSVDI
jgi:hypothetical protein